MSDEGGVDPTDVVEEAATGGVTPRTCKGALGTWRVLGGGIRTLSRKSKVRKRSESYRKAIDKRAAHTIPFK
jgi:hypothetical protein